VIVFRRGYAAAAAGVLALELFIAIAVHDAFVRPFVGDSLAVVLVYLALRAVTRLHVAAAIGAALAIACAVELGQFAGLLDMLGLRGNPLARVVLGAGFDPKDFIAYAAGACAIAAIETFRHRRTARSAPALPR
jgi:hypothetical protein